MRGGILRGLMLRSEAGNHPARIYSADMLDLLWAIPAFQNCGAGIRSEGLDEPAVITALPQVFSLFQAVCKFGLEPPVCSPQSNGMAESLVRTIKRDYVAFMSKPEPAMAMRNLALAFEHYNEHHPHSALKCRSPRECRRRLASSN